MKKVALIVPGKNELYAVQEPLNVGFLASYLEKNGHDVRIIDELAGQNVKKEIKNFQPEVVGITGTTPVIKEAYQIADMCKKEGMLTVMGGPHVSALPIEALKHADIVVKGEGEYALLDIANGKETSGVVTRDYIKDLDSTPPPARHLLQMDYYLKTRDRIQETYLNFIPAKTKTASVIGSRGCPFNCTFCHNSWEGMPYRFNSAERTVGEIKHLVDNYGIGGLFFLDDHLFVNKPRLKKICELMKEKGIEIVWGGNSRVDTLNSEILQTVKKAGCKQITFGFESGSQRILDVLNKRTTVEQMERAVRLCNEAGLLVNGTFMIGNPTETVEDIEKTQDFIKRNNIDSYGVCITTPFPGTKLWDWCEENNLIPEKIDWSKFDYSDIAISACNTITSQKIKELHHETAYLKLSHNPIKLSSAFSRLRRHPIKTVRNVLRKPSRIPNLLKRIEK